MPNKLYKIIGGVAYDVMLKAKNRIVGAAATAFTEGMFKVIGGVAYPITRFDTLPFYMSQSGANMTATYLANNTTLLNSPRVVGMGSSTMFGHGLSSPNRYWDKVTAWFNTNATTPTLYNIAVEGINSASMQTTAQGGTPGQNLDTAFALNPTIIIWDEPTNGLGTYSPAQQIIYWEQAYAACLKRGILIFFNSARPRTPYTTLQQQALKDFNTLLAAHPYLKYISNIDGNSFWNTATTYALVSTYDQGDGIHLNSAGTTLLANDTAVLLPKAYIATTAYSAIEVHRSVDGTNYSLYNSITDVTNYKKTYSHQSGYYKSRGKLKDGSYTSFGTAIQITNSSPTANAGGSQSITLPTSSVTLSGSGSDTDGTITAYLWTKVSGPAFGTITTPTAASTTVTGMTGAGTYVYRLTVTDNEGATGFNDVAITVSAAGNVSPTANAGADQTLAAGATTGTLTGSGSDTDGTIAGYAWSQISGPNTAGITSPSSASTGLTGLIAGAYVFRLTVTDNQGATGFDDVQITAVAAVGQRILIDFGGDGIVDDGQTDGGIMTPNNSITPGTPGQDAAGKWWNNIVNCRAATNPTVVAASIVDITNTIVSGMTISLDKKPGGTFAPVDYSMNYGGNVVAVGDYPATAVQDNLYFHTSAGIVTMVVPIPAGKTGSIKFWGNRNSTGPRILQIRKAGDTTWLEYDATTNTNPATAVTLTGCTGNQAIEFQVKAGSTFGHLSIMDTILT